MNYRISIRRSAERDVANAQEWYEQQQVGLSHSFHEEFVSTVGILSRTPLIYPVLYRNVRRAVLHRFPYLIWYCVEDDLVTIIAWKRKSAKITATAKKYFSVVSKHTPFPDILAKRHATNATVQLPIVEF